MAISAEQVKQLRDKTGAGMMDCKKALTEANGDFDKAIEILRKKGASVAAKRAERSANEGIVLTKLMDDDKTAIMLEVNCETDFVAKSPDFIDFANLALKSLIENKPADLDALLNSSIDGKNINEELTNLMGKIGEKISVSRFVVEKTDSGMIVDYIHHGSKLGVLLRADYTKNNSKEELATLLKDFAMQIAAMKPICIYRTEVPKDVIEKEIDIYKEVAIKEGKPANIAEKIAEGKLNKFYQENCLSEQVFVKDNSKKIDDLVKEFNSKQGSDVKLVNFHRFHLSDENK